MFSYLCATFLAIATKLIIIYNYKYTMFRGKNLFNLASEIAKSRKNLWERKMSYYNKFRAGPSKLLKAFQVLQSVSDRIASRLKIF